MSLRLSRAGLVATALVVASGLAACGSAPTSSPSVPTPPSRSSVGAPSSSGAVSSNTASSNTASSATPSATSASSTSVPTPRSACRMLVDQMSLNQQVGQLLMMGVTNAPVTDDQLMLMDRYQVGSAVLLGTWQGSATVRASTSRITGQNQFVPVIVAADQEGGLIQRITGPGIARIPTATQQGTMKPADLTAQWKTWGSQLKSAGVRYDLAPVADLVPDSKVTTNQPIGELHRYYSTDPTKDAAAVAATVRGLRQAGVGSSLKHFPGLGEVTHNTDFNAATDTTIGTGYAGLQVFRAGIDAGATSVMVSTAIYTRLDPDQQAVFSSAIVTDLLRGKLGFQGVVISDDLGSAASVAQIPSGQRATRFIVAGGDLIINANPDTIGRMSDALVARAKADPAFRERVAQSATRVVTMKQTLGVVSCG